MPEHNLEFGKYGARGIKGSDAVARRLDDLADGISTPVTVRRGWMARLNYLTRSDRSRQAARHAGLTVTGRTLTAWLEGRRAPSPTSLTKIETAYRAVRRQNVARHLLKRLNANGGTRVEIHPLDQSRVARPLQREVGYRHMNVRRWDKIVASWAAGDYQGLEEAWTTDVLPDLGSQWGQYEYVSNIGFAA